MALSTQACVEMHMQCACLLTYILVQIENPAVRPQLLFKVQGWLYLRPVIYSTDMHAFAEQVSTYTKSAFNITLESSDVILDSSASLYNSILLYARAATTVLEKGGDLRDGQTVTTALRNTSFVGIDGTTVAPNKLGDQAVSYEVMNYIGSEGAEHKGMTFTLSMNEFQLQEYPGGYKYCSQYALVTPIIASSVDACKDACRAKTCWALTYYAGLKTEFAQKCYLFMAAAECGRLKDYKGGVDSVWSVPVGRYNRSTGKYTNLSEVVWPGGTTNIPVAYVRAICGLQTVDGKSKAVGGEYFDEELGVCRKCKVGQYFSLASTPCEADISKCTNNNICNSCKRKKNTYQDEEGARTNANARACARARARTRTHAHTH